MRNSPNGNVSRLTSEYMNNQVFLHEQKLRRRKGLVRRLIVLSFFIIIFLTVTGLTLMNQQATLQQQQQNSIELETSLSALQLKESELSEEIELLQDPEYIAEIARRDFLLTYPNETLFQIPSPSSYSD